MLIMFRAPFCSQWVTGQNALPTDLHESRQDIKALGFSWEESDRLLGTDDVVGTMHRKSWSLPPLDGSNCCMYD